VPASLNFCYTFLLGCRFQLGNLKRKICKEIKYKVSGVAGSVYGFIKKLSFCYEILTSILR
jgi:hypothetical protein